jgi:hypothetical protein
MSEVDAAYKRGVEMGRAMAVAEMSLALFRIAQTGTDALTAEPIGTVSAPEVPE